MIGGFDRESDRIFKSRPLSYLPGYSLNSHKVSGSYKWELKFNGFMYGDEVSAEGAPYRVLIDTGTSDYLMPYGAWKALFRIICRNLPFGT